MSTSYTNLFLKCQNYLTNCLANNSSWKSNSHLKVNNTKPKTWFLIQPTPKTSSCPVFPFSGNGPSVPSVTHTHHPGIVFHFLPFSCSHPVCAKSPVHLSNPSSCSHCSLLQDTIISTWPAPKASTFVHLWLYLLFPSPHFYAVLHKARVDF